MGGNQLWDPFERILEVVPLEAYDVLFLETNMEKNVFFLARAGDSSFKKLRADLDRPASHLPKFYSDPCVTAVTLKS